jgi:FAD/FMN-containing dehydrogenase/Fe-S oxidoreductase
MNGSEGEVAQSVTEFLFALKPRVDGELRTDVYSRMFYSTDASIYQVMPYAVLLPRSAEDIQAAVALAGQYGVPLLPRASGTSLAGQAVNKALVMDVSRHMDQILEVNAAERWVRVQPGVVLDDLNRELKPYGLQFGPDPASSDRAAMGGIVSNNSTGAHSILYGMTADHVLEMEAILSDGQPAHFGPVAPDDLDRFLARGGLEGRVYRELHALVSDEANQATIRAGTPRHWRRCGGYNLDRFVPAEGLNFRWKRDERFNLARMVCGAEGTLAVISEVKLNLVPTPEKTAVVNVPFDSLRGALEAVPAILESEPSAVELLDNLGLRLCRQVPEYARLLATFVEGHPFCLLITEYQGQTEGELQAKIQRLRLALKASGAGAGSLSVAMTERQQANVWKVRKVGLGLLMSVKGDHKPIPFIEDAAVPVEHLAEYIGRLEEMSRQLGNEIACYAHASAGCIHIRPLINTKIAGDIAKMPQLLSFAVEMLHGYGGSLSSEHGDGRARSWLNERFFGPDLYRLYRQVKGLFDPGNLLNPGNIVDGPLMTENLRYGPEYKVSQLSPLLDFSHEQGFDRAVEMCNGAGVCRKRFGGTMCPSFMVTREEEHSTRGRANALRAAMSGLLPPAELTSRRMYDVLDLCISCKGCAAECPSSVDMAKIKVEFLAQYYAMNGTPFRARLFGDINRLSRWSSGRLAGMANGALRNRAIRSVMEKSVGISARRPMPPFAAQSFTDWYARRDPAPDAGHFPEVVLFNDTFNTYNYPGVSIAAVELLEAAGFRVLLPGHGCCGRPMISKGLVPEARAAALETIRRLAPLAERGLPIVGLEPSCLLMLRDEYHYLLPSEPGVDQVARQAFTLEEFLVQLADGGTLNLPFGGPARRLLLHGHCHQKALVGSGPGLKALSLPPGYEVEEVDSGCCGMAGSFGFEAEHYEISMAMAEQRLLPAVRQTGEEYLIVAAGASCRQQITHGTGRRALHPAEVLRDALRGPEA